MRLLERMKRWQSIWRMECETLFPPFDPHVYECCLFFLPDLQMTEVLKITPTDLETTVIDTVNSFIDQGIVKKSKKCLKKEKEETDAVTAAPAENGGDEGKTLMFLSYKSSLL